MRKRQHKKNIKKQFGLILKKGNILVKIYFKMDHVDATEELHRVCVIDNSKGKHPVTIKFPGMG